MTLTENQIALPGTPRGWRAGASRRPVIIVVFLLTSVVLTLIAARITSPWKLDLRFDNDTVRYYDTQNFEVHGVSDFFRAISEPFFRAPDAGLIEAPAGKPVLVDILRLWGMGTRLFLGQNAWVTREHYFQFQLFAYGLLVFSICLLAWRLKAPYLGVLTAIVALLSPWAMVQLVFRNYTCIGMALLACVLALRRCWWSSLLAGVLAWMAFLTDNAILLYSGMLGLVLAASFWGQWKRLLVHGLLFGAGIFVPYAILTVAGWIWYRGYHGPIQVTIEYFTFFAKANHFATRPPPEARPDVPKFPGIVLVFIKENSWTICGLLIITTLVMYWKTAKLGFKAAFRHPAVGPILVLLLPTFVVWIGIDIKPGAQVAHSYFVAYPLAVLAVVLFWWRVANRGVILRCLWGLAAVVFTIESIRGLYRYRVVFFSLQNSMDAVMTSDPHQKIAMLYNDPHSKIIQHLLSPEYADRIVIIMQMDDVGQRAMGKPIHTFSMSGPGLAVYSEKPLEKEDYVSYILFGPLSNETMVYCLPTPKWTDDPYGGERQVLFASNTLKNNEGREVVTFEEPERIPFYGLYPLLLFDDEWPTWRFLAGVYNDDSCVQDPGIIRLSRIKYGPDFPNGPHLGGSVPAPP